MSGDSVSVSAQRPCRRLRRALLRYQQQAAAEGVGTHHPHSSCSTNPYSTGARGVRAAWVRARSPRRPRRCRRGAASAVLCERGAARSELHCPPRSQLGQSRSWAVKRNPRSVNVTCKPLVANFGGSPAPCSGQFAPKIATCFPCPLGPRPSAPRSPPSPPFFQPALLLSPRPTLSCGFVVFFHRCCISGPGCCASKKCSSNFPDVTHRSSSAVSTLPKINKHATNIFWPCFSTFCNNKNNSLTLILYPQPPPLAFHDKFVLNIFVFFLKEQFGKPNTVRC